ncbi:Heat shock protein DnaJ [Drechmeria coniospora]|uniref:Heat shock protein DnaJ n=1 Tax=Drechmeria coniospora TaxID=98403 RepID=A0A151GT73_DRECN|nr:Heat shock protein DnaJ [Drechmeria coniospora]KYK60305.1 Heat shock protein DnaJ [Drechmeria coniospora]
MCRQQLATSWIQTIFYGITIRAGDPKPVPGSARHAAHRRIINIAVVAVYLAYTIYEADYEIRGRSSFFEDLGVAINADDRQIKSRFRRLAALHHPDKVTSSTPQDSANYFIHLKLASDTLQDAARRFAYERFGPSIAEWRKCVTIKEFVSHGVLSGILPYYGVVAGTIYIVGLFGYMEFGKFYRWLFLITLCLFEVHAVTRPTFPLVIDLLNAYMTRMTSHPAYLPFQVIELARKLTVTVYIALAQIGPLLATQQRQSTASAESEEKVLSNALDRLEHTATQLNTDSARLMEMELSPFKGDPLVVRNLQGKMREWLVQNTIRSDPLVKDALGKSFVKRRIDAPSGAKGNR